MIFQVQSIAPDEHVLVIHPGEGALCSLTTYCPSPEVNIHGFTPADARAMAETLKAWADSLESVQAVTE